MKIDILEEIVEKEKRTMSQLNCKVEALWDVDAQVWSAKSDDVPGLATEADTLEALTEKLRIMVPELLQLNQVISDNQVSTVVD